MKVMTYLHYAQKTPVKCPHCGCGTIACGVGILVDVPDLPEVPPVEEHLGDHCLCDHCGEFFAAYCTATVETRLIQDMESSHD